ncbi:hypothetical protein ACQP1G_20900 [Nocardia sp. CA-107356]|uniref:hypothetical protein n=1 Tax=Nocardia sp. CA-107356 TaxID=3239972 RepID=UPI003D94E3AB
MHRFEPEHVDVGGGRSYTVEFPYDLDADSPRICNNTILVVNRGGDVSRDEADDRSTLEAHALLHFLDEVGWSRLDQIERRFNIWRAITGSSFQLFTGSDYATAHQSDWFHYLMLAESAADAEGDLAVCRTWLGGEVFGWVLLSPNGERVESCFGYYTIEPAEQDWRATLETAEKEAIQEASIVGAGFVGLM